MKRKLDQWEGLLGELKESIWGKMIRSYLFLFPRKKIQSSLFLKTVMGKEQTSMTSEKLEEEPKVLSQCKPPIGMDYLLAQTRLSKTKK